MTRIHRTTKETDILVNLDMNTPGDCCLKSDLPFFNHMLHAMAFHGRFTLEVEARGDIEVDPHHLVEDTGIVIGMALEDIRRKSEGIARYGNAIIPMDDALGQAVVDACGRPYIVYKGIWPQTHAGDFDISLLREFWGGLVNHARINLHLQVHYAENSHHAAEALFKAAGRALSQAYTPISGGEKAMSTKGKL